MIGSFRRWLPPPRMSASKPQHRSIMVVDIAGSARWHNQDQLHARAALMAAMRAAARAARLDLGDLAVEDRGDGMILLIPPSVSKVDILDPIVPHLAGGIHQHNVNAQPTQRIRLRVAVHAGEVHRDKHGWVGTDVITACRLVDGEALYQHLNQTPRADLVLVVSDLIYQWVVRNRYQGIDPADYSRVRIVAKEFDTFAWLHTPYAGLPPLTSTVGSVIAMNGFRRFSRRDVPGGTA